MRPPESLQSWFMDVLDRERSQSNAGSDGLSSGTGNQAGLVSWPHGHRRRRPDGPGEDSALSRRCRTFATALDGCAGRFVVIFYNRRRKGSRKRVYVLLELFSLAAAALV